MASVMEAASAFLMPGRRVTKVLPSKKLHRNHCRRKANPAASGARIVTRRESRLTVISEPAIAILEPIINRLGYPLD